MRIRQHSTKRRVLCYEFPFLCNYLQPKIFLTPKVNVFTPSSNRESGLMGEREYNVYTR